MKTKPSYRAYVATLPLTEALWWFIENMNDVQPERSTIFFDLHARFRTEYQS